MESEEGGDVRTRVARCGVCNREYDRHTAEYYILFADVFTRDVSDSMLRLGLRGEVRGQRFEIIGRIRYQDERSTGVAVWDEWLVIDGDGEYHWIVERGGRYYVFESFDASVFTFDAKGALRLNESEIVRHDRSDVRVVEIAGRLTETPPLWERVVCYEFKRGGARYIIGSWKGRLHVRSGRGISKASLMKYFLSDEYDELYGGAIKEQKAYRRSALVYLCMAFLSAVMVAACFFSTREIPGVMERVLVIADNADAGEGISVSRVLYGPVRLTEKNALYEISVGADEAVQPLNGACLRYRVFLVPEDTVGAAGRSPRAAGELFDGIASRPEPLELYMADGELYERPVMGRRGSAIWKNLSAAHPFVACNAGSYYLYAEAWSARKRDVKSVIVGMRETHCGMRWYAAALVFFAVAAVFSRERSRRGGIQRPDRRR